MNTQIIIDVLRHGSKNGDALTAVGEAQVEASARLLVSAPFQRLLYSGAVRTHQTSCIVQREAGVKFLPEENAAFNFGNLIGPCGGREVVLAEIAQVQATEDTVAFALETSAYARAARSQLRDALMALATDMVTKGQTRAIACSHGPYAEMATSNPGDMPYGINEGDWIRYVIEDGQILSTTLNRCPIPGGRN